MMSRGERSERRVESSLPEADPEPSILEELQDAKFSKEIRLFVTIISKMTDKIMGGVCCEPAGEGLQITKLQSGVHDLKH